MQHPASPPHAPSATSPTERTDTLLPPDGPRLLITGATGMIGRLLVDELLARGAALTAMVRPSRAAEQLAGRRGVQVLHGDFDDSASMRRALEGIDSAFLLTNSTERTQHQQLSFVEAARAAGVSHIVKLSQLHAAAESPVRFLRYHAAVEQAIDAAGILRTSVRPNLVLQSYLAFAAPIAAGVLPAPIGEAGISAVDARDIAAVAAVALTDATHSTTVGSEVAAGDVDHARPRRPRTLDVTGPAAVSHHQIAAAFARATGHQVAFQQVEPRAFLAMLISAGMEPWQAQGLVEDYAHYERGEATDVSQDVAAVTGRSPRTVEDFARDYAEALKPPA